MGLELIEETIDLENNEIKEISKNHKIEIIQYEMMDKVLEKVIKISVSEFLKLENKINIQDNKENFCMLLCKNIQDKLNKEFLHQNQNWQIIAGTNYGTFVTHESFFFVYFKYRDFCFTVFVSS